MDFNFYVRLRQMLWTKDAREKGIVSKSVAKSGMRILRKFSQSQQHGQAISEMRQDMRVKTI